MMFDRPGNGERWSIIPRITCEGISRDVAVSILSDISLFSRIALIFLSLDTILKKIDESSSFVGKHEFRLIFLRGTYFYFAKIKNSSLRFVEMLAKQF